MVDEKPLEDLEPSEGDAQLLSEAEQTHLLDEQFQEALREKDQFRAMAQRAQADLVNYKRRVADEQQELRRTAKTQLILKILSVVDDLERALALVPEDAVALGWIQGLRLVQRNIDNILETEGVSKIDARGRPFEPREHEALSYEETSDSQEGIVIRVIRDGYTLHDRVLRAAQVAVSKAPETDNRTETEDQEV